MKKLGGVILGVAIVGLVLAGAAAMAQNKPTSLSGSDYGEINALYAKYNHAYDSSNQEAYGGVFTTDGQFVIGERVLNGRKEIGALAKGTGSTKARPKIFHLGSSVAFEATPEGAKGSSYVVLMDLQKNPAITGGGVYEDMLVKTKEGWRFKKRSYFPEPAPAPVQSSAK